MTLQPSLNACCRSNDCFCDKVDSTKNFYNILNDSMIFEKAYRQDGDRGFQIYCSELEDFLYVKKFKKNLAAFDFCYRKYGLAVMWTLPTRSFMYNP